MLRNVCVTKQRWLSEPDFEDAVVACNLLPGPASTQLAIYCALRIRGRVGAVVGGLAFIVPGLLLVLVLSSLFLSTAPPAAVAGAGAGAGAAVGAVALHAAISLIPASWARASNHTRSGWILYLAAGAIAGATVGQYMVIILLLCGFTELVRRSSVQMFSSHGFMFALPATIDTAGAIEATRRWGALAWTAFKVGGLAYGGGFVIVPLMRADAVDHHHWMTSTQFLNAVVLGQITPGPVTHTVAAVGFAAAGLRGALLAAGFAFTPSFIFILVGGRRFDRLRANRHAQTFMLGAGPAAIGAILGSAVPLTTSLTEPWQYAIVPAASLALVVKRVPIHITLLCAAAIGTAITLASG